MNKVSKPPESRGGIGSGRTVHGKSLRGVGFGNRATRLSLLWGRRLPRRVKDDYKPTREESFRMIRMSNFLERHVRAARQQVRTLLESRIRQPLQTREVNVEYARDELRVESHMVLNIFTGAIENRLQVTLARPQEFTIQVIPVLSDGRVVLVVRFAYATGRWSLELPRLDGQEHDDGWSEPARRCLGEQAGLESQRWALGGSFYLDPHRSPTSVLSVLATDCQPLRAPESCAGQVAGTIAVGREALYEMLRAGDIECSLSLAGLALLQATAWAKFK